MAGSRPDVKAAFPSYPNNDWGWGTQVLSNFLPGGNGNFVLHAIAYDPYGRSADVGRASISVNNAASHAPFGTIDTPAEGATVSGTSYVNYGWALTPQPNIIPFDGSTIVVWVDGQASHPVYNQFRSDLASLFPGLRNSGGAAGYYIFDTTQLTPGQLHTISWAVTDSVGNGTGMGNRYFSVGGGTFAMAGHPAGGGGGAYVYNDNVTKIFSGGGCSLGADCRTLQCSISPSSNVTVLAVHQTRDYADVSITANYGAATGGRTLTCGTPGGISDSAGVSVYDATPVVTSVERYDGPPGNHAFLQGEGSVGVRILGHNMGKNPFNDTSRLTVSGAGVTVQYITGWRDDGSEIDAVFNIDSASAAPTQSLLPLTEYRGKAFKGEAVPPRRAGRTGK